MNGCRALRGANVCGLPAQRGREFRGHDKQSTREGGSERGRRLTHNAALVGLTATHKAASNRAHVSPRPEDETGEDAPPPVLPLAPLAAAAAAAAVAAAGLCRK